MPNFDHSDRSNRRLQALETFSYRRMMEVKMTDKIFNEEILKRIDSKGGNIFTNTKREISLKDIRRRDNNISFPIKEGRIEGKAQRGHPI